MYTLLENNLLSKQDARRLEKSFFSKPSLKKATKIKSISLISLLVIILATVIIVFIQNYNILILPSSDRLINATDLLSAKHLVELELIKDAGNSKIKNFIYLDSPIQREIGFNINFKEETDLNNVKLIVVIKKTLQDFNLDLILRDKSFKSNARNPIHIQVKTPDAKSEFIQIPISFYQDTNYNLNFTRIKQIRLIFSQKEGINSPILVKNIFLQKTKDG
ncbi:MAG: hypothetical protein KJ593_07190 [Candidatus Omnitrophica bacterium]|nr:hypothetical protein [Candidatus Omnitrophota bacterium]